MKNNLKKYTRATPQHPTPNLLFNCIFLSKKRKANKTILKNLKQTHWRKKLLKKTIADLEIKEN